VQAGDQGEVLLRVTDRLLDELASATPLGAPGARSTLGDEGVMAGILGADEEQLVRRVRESLARIAAMLDTGHEDPPIPAVAAALGGAEMVMRGELVSGGAGRLPRLLPSFVFLVALPIVEQDRALVLSRRTSELIAEETDAGRE
jgi:hypothetical protein